jgi:hypothetical protein
VPEKIALTSDQFSGSGPWRQPTSQSWKVPTDYVFLTAAWDALIAEFRRCIEQGKLLLEGVPSGDDPLAGSEAIPSMWAAELKLDLVANVVSRGPRRWLAVAVSKRGAAPPPSPTVLTSVAVAEIGPGEVPAPGILTIETVRTLDPETVAALLELHAKHVCTDLRVNLNQPGKASVIALAAAKMKARANAGQLRPFLVEEAEWLERWCAAVAPSYQALGAKTIANKLGALFRDLQGAKP